MRYVLAVLSMLAAAAPAWAADPSNLTATGRTDTKLYFQWQSNGNTRFTVDYLGPEYFGGQQPTCSDFPQHNSVLITESDVIVIEGLQPSTWYHIHVHAVDSNGLVVGNPTNVIIVKTGAAGSAFEALAPGSSDYIICGGNDGGGGGGGGEEGCAQVTFTLLPGSVSFPTVTLTIVDPPSGTEVATVTLPIGEPHSAGAGSYHLRFSAPEGYDVSPTQRGVNLACGDDTVVRLRFRAAPPGHR